MVLAAGSRSHGDKFGETGEDGDVADPDDEVAIDDTSRATVGETLCCENKTGFPSDEDSAAEAENGHESKVALESDIVSFYRASCCWTISIKCSKWPFV